MRLLIVLLLASSLYANENLPTIYGLHFGMNKAQALETLKQHNGLQKPDITEKIEQLGAQEVKLVIIKAKATAEQESKWQGLRSVELTLHKDVLFEMNIFVYGNGGETFVTTIKKLSKFLGKDVANGQFLLKDFLVKTASNHLDITDMNQALETGLITAEYLQQMRKFWQELQKKQE